MKKFIAVFAVFAVFAVAGPAVAGPLDWLADKVGYTSKDRLKSVEENLKAVSSELFIVRAEKIALVDEMRGLEKSLWEAVEKAEVLTWAFLLVAGLIALSYARKAYDGITWTFLQVREWHQKRKEVKPSTS